MIKSLSVDFVAPEKMRYPTFDDYVEDGDVLRVTIADTGNPQSNAAVLVHALVEYFVAARSGVTVEEIDNWDMTHTESEEPGEIWECPYRQAHHTAMNAERQFLRALGVPWAAHDWTLEQAAMLLPAP